MIVPELHLVQVEGKLLGRDAMVLEQLPLRVTPEAFEPVDMDFAPCDMLCINTAQKYSKREGWGDRNVPASSSQPSNRIVEEDKGNDDDKSMEGAICGTCHSLGNLERIRRNACGNRGGAAELAAELFGDV